MAIYHGGALDLAMAQYGGAAVDWIDLSTGINPYHYPIDEVSRLAWTQLPQTAALNALNQAASCAYNCAVENIMAANGTQALIECLPKIFEASTVAILSPTYEEHAECWRKLGHKVVLVETIEQGLAADHFIIVNPNNPTGKLFAPEEMQEIAVHFADKSGYLIIDEAFMDMTPEMSMAGKVGMQALIILRSFGKFFGLAGARIGFLLAEQELLAKMQPEFGLWNINGMAMHVATKALNDQDWQQNMRLKLSRDMLQMLEIFEQEKLEIIGKTDLFCLVGFDEKELAYKYFEKLAEQHILCRKFEKNSQILRFGLCPLNAQKAFAERLAKCKEPT